MRPLDGNCFVPKNSVWKLNEIVGSGELRRVWDEKKQLQLDVIADREMLSRVKEVEELIEGQKNHFTIIETYHTERMKEKNRIKLMLELDREFRLIEVIFVKTEEGRRVKQDCFQNLGVLSKELIYSHYPSIRLWNKERDEVEFFDIQNELIHSFIDLKLI